MWHGREIVAADLPPPLPTIQRSKHPVLGLGQLETFLISSLIFKIKNISNFSPKLNKNFHKVASVKYIIP